jgi:hypothetical protein
MLGISNIHTQVMGRVASDTNLCKQDMDPLVEEAQRLLPYDQLYIWNANIDGVVVQLRTNNFHLIDLWIDNWFPAPIEGLQPHGVIYAVTGVPDREPHAYYCSQTHTAVLFNTDYYGQCKSWALGLVADFMEMQRNVHSIHGALVDIGGCGIAFIAPTGTGKSTHSYGLALSVPRARIHSDDWFYVAYQGGREQPRATAYISERQFYLRTDMAANFPRIAQLFDRCKLENVGETYDQVPNSRAMLDPRWIGGEDCFVHVTQLRAVVLLRRDSHSPPILRLEAAEAIDILRQGEFTIQPGAGPPEQWGQTKREPFYNPYLLVRGEERTRLQETFFRRLFTCAEVHIINTGVESIDESRQHILDIAQICSAGSC